MAKLSLLLFINYAHLLFLVSATTKQHCFCCCKFLAQSEKYAAADCGTIWRRRVTKYASSASFVRGSVCYHFYVVANSTTKFLHVAATQQLHFGSALYFALVTCFSFLYTHTNNCWALSVGGSRGSTKSVASHKTKRKRR